MAHILTSCYAHHRNQQVDGSQTGECASHYHNPNMELPPGRLQIRGQRSQEDSWFPGCGGIYLCRVWPHVHTSLGCGCMYVCTYRVWLHVHTSQGVAACVATVGYMTTHMHTNTHSHTPEGLHPRFSILFCFRRKMVNISTG